MQKTGICTNCEARDWQCVNNLPFRTWLATKNSDTGKLIVGYPEMATFIAVRANKPKSA